LKETVNRTETANILVHNF